MELIKTIWQPNNKKQFLNYLLTLKNPQRVDFFTRVINTRLPVLAIPTPQIKKIATEIARGNFLSFLNLNINDYYETVLLNGLLICKIKDFQQLKTRLIAYAEQIDNWACCDLLNFNINRNNEQAFFNLSKQMFASDFPFERRVGVRLWFKLIHTNVLPEIFDLISATNRNENEYYVNMAIAWFLCECYIKQPEKTNQFLTHHNLNPITLNKFVGKCQDSFRISPQDKRQLKTLLKTF